MVSNELLEILRCPVCVHNEPEGGELLLHGSWLVCQDCSRTYPIRDDIPVMLVDEGDRFRGISPGELPKIPPPEKPPVAPAGDAAAARPQDNLEPLIFLGAAGLLLGIFLAWLLWERAGKRCER